MMDGHHYPPHDRFPGHGPTGSGNAHAHPDAFHRHSQSTGLDFTALMHAHLASHGQQQHHHQQHPQHRPHHQTQPQQTIPPHHVARLSAAAAAVAAAATPTPAAYESHDDLCVDRCMGVGLYNSFQQFNHRGGPAPSSLHARWARENPLARYDFQMDHQVDLSMPVHFRPADLAPQPSTLFHHHQHQHHQGQQHHQQQHWYHQLDPCDPCGPCDPCAPCDPCDPCVPCTDDDCQSTADSCCDSQCTMTDKCTNVACADTDDACTDQSCPERPPVSLASSEVVSGAAALISINHSPEETTSHQHQHDFDLQQQGELSRVSVVSTPRRSPNPP